MFSVFGLGGMNLFLFLFYLFPEVVTSKYFPALAAAADVCTSCF
jgi:hypothetical protein